MLRAKEMVAPCPQQNDSGSSPPPKANKISVCLPFSSLSTKLQFGGGRPFHRSPGRIGSGVPHGAGVARAGQGALQILQDPEDHPHLAPIPRPDLGANK